MHYQSEKRSFKGVSCFVFTFKLNWESDAQVWKNKVLRTKVGPACFLCGRSLQMFDPELVEGWGTLWHSEQPA